MNGTLNGSMYSQFEIAVYHQAVEPLASKVIRIPVSLFIFIFGVIGNIMVFYVVYNNHRMRTAMNFFLVNLAVCDFIVCLICVPFTVIYYEIKRWPFGIIWCKLLPTIMVTAVMASTGSLLAVTIERYRYIVLPMSLHLSTTQAKLIITLIWLVAFFVALPEFGAFKLVDGDLYTCMEKFPEEQYRRIYSIFLFLVGYFIPLIILFPAYFQMLRRLRARDDLATQCISGVDKASRDRQKGSAFKMLLTVVVCYAVLLLPQHAMYFWMDFGQGLSFQYFSMLMSYCQLLTWLNSMANPIIYSIFSGQFHRGFSRILCFACRRKYIRANYLSEHPISIKETKR